MAQIRFGPYTLLGTNPLLFRLGMEIQRLDTLLKLTQEKPILQNLTLFSPPNRLPIW